MKRNKHILLVLLKFLMRRFYLALLIFVLRFLSKYVLILKVKIQYTHEVCKKKLRMFSILLSTFSAIKYIGLMFLKRAAQLFVLNYQSFSQKHESYLKRAIGDLPLQNGTTSGNRYINGDVICYYGSFRKSKKTDNQASGEGSGNEDQDRSGGGESEAAAASSGQKIIAPETEELGAAGTSASTSSQMPTAEGQNVRRAGLRSNSRNSQRSDRSDAFNEGLGLRIREMALGMKRKAASKVDGPETSVRGTKNRPLVQTESRSSVIKLRTNIHAGPSGSSETASTSQAAENNVFFNRSEDSIDAAESMLVLECINERSLVEQRDTATETIQNEINEMEIFPHGRQDTCTPSASTSAACPTEIPRPEPATESESSNDNVQSNLQLSAPTLLKILKTPKRYEVQELDPQMLDQIMRGISDIPPQTTHSSEQHEVRRSPRLQGNLTVHVPVIQPNPNTFSVEHPLVTTREFYLNVAQPVVRSPTATPLNQEPAVDPEVHPAARVPEFPMTSQTQNAGNVHDILIVPCRRSITPLRPQPHYLRPRCTPSIVPPIRNTQNETSSRTFGSRISAFRQRSNTSSASCSQDSATGEASKSATSLQQLMPLTLGLLNAPPQRPVPSDLLEKLAAENTKRLMKGPRTQLLEYLKKLKSRNSASQTDSKTCEQDIQRSIQQEGADSRENLLGPTNQIGQGTTTSGENLLDPTDSVGLEEAASGGILLAPIDSVRLEEVASGENFPGPTNQIRQGTTTSGENLLDPTDSVGLEEAASGGILLAPTDSVRLEEVASGENFLGPTNQIGQGISTSGENFLDPTDSVGLEETASGGILLAPTDSARLEEAASGENFLGPSNQIGQGTTTSGGIFLAPTDPVGQEGGNSEDWFLAPIDSVGKEEIVLAENSVWAEENIEDNCVARADPVEQQDDSERSVPVPGQTPSNALKQPTKVPKCVLEAIERYPKQKSESELSESQTTSFENWPNRFSQTNEFSSASPSNQLAKGECIELDRKKNIRFSAVTNENRSASSSTKTAKSSPIEGAAKSSPVEGAAKSSPIKGFCDGGSGNSVEISETNRPRPFVSIQDDGSLASTSKWMQCEDETGKKILKKMDWIINRARSRRMADDYSITTRKRRLMNDGSKESEMPGSEDSPRRQLIDTTEENTSGSSSKRKLMNDGSKESEMSELKDSPRRRLIDTTEENTSGSSSKRMTCKHKVAEDSNEKDVSQGKNSQKDRTTEETCAKSSRLRIPPVKIEQESSGSPRVTLDVSGGRRRFVFQSSSNSLFPRNRQRARLWNQQSTEARVNNPKEETVVSGKSASEQTNATSRSRQSKLRSLQTSEASSDKEQRGKGQSTSQGTSAASRSRDSRLRNLQTPEPEESSTKAQGGNGKSTSEETNAASRSRQSTLRNLQPSETEASGSKTQAIKRNKNTKK